MSFIWALIIAADVIAVLFFMAGVQNRVRYVTNDYNLELIQNFEESSENASGSVVFFGNSRLRHAVNVGYFVEEVEGKEKDNNITVMQFAPNAARFSLFKNVTDEILSIKPSIIVIQDSIISNAPNRVPNAVSWSKTIYGFLFRKASNVDPYEVWKNDRQSIMSEKACMESYTQRDIDMQLAFNRDRDSHSLSDENTGYQLAKDFIQKAVEQGITVVILSIPPDLENLSDFHVKQHQTDFFGIGYTPSPEELLPKTYNKVEWWRDAPAYPSDHYCDLVHLNQKGRGLFSKWLLDNLQSLL
jgi:hypothetical protein